MRKEKEILSLFNKWASDNQLIRAAILTGSRAQPGARVDFLSDYDIELYVSDLSRFKQNDDWLEEFGPIMVRWPYRPRSTVRERWITRLVLFKDGVRIDFQITDHPEIDSQAYDNGYQVLIDKDGLTTGITEPTFSEFIIEKPDRDDYETLVNEFWWDAYYVPKYLWRDELPFARYMLDYMLRYSFLHKIIDWYIGIQNDWSVETGKRGAKYKKYLVRETWEEYKETYAGGDKEESWQAFFKTTTLFAKIARKVGEKLDYDYPDRVEEEVMEFCQQIKLTEKKE